MERVMVWGMTTRFRPPQIYKPLWKNRGKFLLPGLANLQIVQEGKIG